MAYELPNAATQTDLLGFARKLFPEPNDLVEIRYESLPHGIRATVVVTSRIWNAISRDTTYDLIETIAKAMQRRSIGGGDRPSFFRVLGDRRLTTNYPGPLSREGRGSRYTRLT